MLKRLRHRLGFHQWKKSYSGGWETVQRYGYAWDDKCATCGAWRERVWMDDSPWGIRTRTLTSITVRKAWH